LRSSRQNSMGRNASIGPATLRARGRGSNTII
jgi:hypothetical protein